MGVQCHGQVDTQVALTIKLTSMPCQRTLQAMANDFDLNIGNNIRMRDTQFINMFWPKTLMKCILPCIHLEHTGGINLYFDTKHDLKDRKKRNNVFVRCFGTND